MCLQDLRESLSRDVRAWANFYGFPNSQRNMYIRWVSGAKTEATRRDELRRSRAGRHRTEGQGLVDGRVKSLQRILLLNGVLVQWPPGSPFSSLGFRSFVLLSNFGFRASDFRAARPGVSPSVSAPFPDSLHLHLPELLDGEVEVFEGVFLLGRVVLQSSSASWRRVRASSGPEPHLCADHDGFPVVLAFALRRISQAAPPRHRGGVGCRSQMPNRMHGHPYRQTFEQHFGNLRYAPPIPPLEREITPTSLIVGRAKPGRFGHQRSRIPSTLSFRPR